MTALRFLVWFAGTLVMIVGSIEVGSWLSQSWVGTIVGIVLACALFADGITGWSLR